MKDQPAHDAFYLVHRPTIWERLGFGACLAPRPDADEHAEGFEPSWIVCTTHVHLDWRDRLRVLVSGHLMVDLALKTDVPVKRHSASSVMGVMPPSEPRVKWVGRLDRGNRLLRLFRVMWSVGQVGDGKGYSAKFSVGLRPTLFRWRREGDGWLLTVLGIRLHMQRSYGGRFA